MTLTRRDFERLAVALGCADVDPVADAVFAEVADACQWSNPRFDRERFAIAVEVCRPYSGRIALAPEDRRLRERLFASA